MTEDGIFRPGDSWDGHYRGTKYRCSPRGRLSWSLPGDLARVNATSGFEDILESLLSLRPEGGSIRITETGAVLTRMPETWEAVYVCEHDLPITFESVDILGDRVQPLDLWPSFYDGARYSYKSGNFWFKNTEDGVWQQTKEKLPSEMEARFRQVKPEGGSIRITENGKVLALIEPQPLPRHMKPQYEALNNLQKRMIAVKK